MRPRRLWLNSELQLSATAECAACGRCAGSRSSVHIPKRLPMRKRSMQQWSGRCWPGLPKGASCSRRVVCAGHAKVSPVPAA